MRKYLIVVEKTGLGFSAYCPDLDGCVAAGATPAEVEKNMQEAIEMHLEAMAEDGIPAPEPQAYSTHCEAQQ